MERIRTKVRNGVNLGRAGYKQHVSPRTNSKKPGKISPPPTVSVNDLELNIKLFPKKIKDGATQSTGRRLAQITVRLTPLRGEAGGVLDGRNFRKYHCVRHGTRAAARAVAPAGETGCRKTLSNRTRGKEIRYDQCVPPCPPRISDGRRDARTDWSGARRIRPGLTSSLSRDSWVDTSN
eukprot:scaffold132410_cov46-Prasinocladus_malaysianus.AAC.3